jgi:hypothetical protein
MQPTMKAHLLRNTGLQQKWDTTKGNPAYIWSSCRLRCFTCYVCGFKIHSLLKQRERENNWSCRSNCHRTMPTKLLSYICTIRHWTFHPIILYIRTVNWDSSVSTMPDYRTAGVRFLAEARQLSLLYSIQTGSESQPTSYPMGTRGPFPVDKANRAWSRSLTSI